MDRISLYAKVKKLRVFNGDKTKIIILLLPSKFEKYQEEMLKGQKD